MNKRIADIVVVDFRSSSFLLGPSHHPCGLQEGSPLRPEDDRRASQDKPEARDSRPGM